MGNTMNEPIYYFYLLGEIVIEAENVDWSLFLSLTDCLLAYFLIFDMDLKIKRE